MVEAVTVCPKFEPDRDHHEQPLIIAVPSGIYGRLSLRHRSEIIMTARAPAGKGAPPIRAVVAPFAQRTQAPPPEKGQARELGPDLRSGPVP
jgi:hypothetical protein